MKVDFLIVGGGLAGASFASLCLKNNASFLMIDNDQNKASRVAAGVYNPVVLKRLNPAWHAKFQMHLWHAHYQNIRNYTKVDLTILLGCIDEYLMLKNKITGFMLPMIQNLLIFF